MLRRVLALRRSLSFRAVSLVFSMIRMGKAIWKRRRRIILRVLCMIPKSIRAKCGLNVM
jgi:hypothetical protein